ncbi:Ig-like domain-containing protein [Listeria rocourtiae]|uniref:beta strand repeat-containing protein n=1 Tax=Listeria rocourtiae TaxID=647910 RepID=UPI003D2F66E1
MKLEQKGPINVLSMKTLKKAAKTALIATVVASQIITVLPTGSHAAEATGGEVVAKEAPSADVVAQKYAPLGATLALDGGVTEKRQQVSTFAEFKAAAESGTVNVIEITGDFQLASNVTVNSNIRIEGNGHTISAASFQVIMKSNSIIDLEDLIMTNVGTKAIFTGYTSSAAPTVNIIDNVQIRGMIMGGTGKLSLSIAGTNNRLVNAERQGMDVDSLEIADNTQIDQLEALETAVKVRTSGSVNIGDNAKINMMSNKGYAFDVSNSALVVGENTVINSASKYGTLKAATLVVKNGANLTLASGDVGNGIYVSGNITIGDNVKVKATGTGTAIYAYNPGASIIVGKDADIDVVSDNGSGIYGNSTITFGDRSSLKLRTHDRGIYSAGAATIRFGSVSNQNPQPEDRVKIDIDSGTSYGIYSGGPIIFGDNTEVGIKAKADGILAPGNSRVDFGANTLVNVTSSSGDGVNAGGIKFGDNASVYVKAYTNGLETTNTSGEGISTGKNVDMTIVSPNHDGIYTYKDTTFGDNNNISITALNSHAIHSFYGGSVKLGTGSSLYLNAGTGVIQEGGAAATFNVGNGSLVKIESSDYGINTSGSITFAENAKANIRAASGQGNYPAIKANGVVTFSKNTMAYVETLSNTSTTVFDLTGAQSSKLVLNAPKYIDFRQNNRAVAGHIIRGYGNDSASYVSRVEMNNMAKVYAWEHAADWSKATGSEWNTIDNVKIPLTYKVGSTYTSYYSGLATGENIDGFSLFDYSRVSTEGSSIIERPAVSPIYENDKTVSGTGVAGDDIVVTFPDGKTAKATVDVDGKWTVNVPTGTTLVKDQNVLTYQTNGVNDSSRVTTKVQADNRVPTAPTVDSVKAGDTVVNGEGVPGNTIAVKLPDGTTATGTVKPDGTFSVTVPAQEAGAVLDVTQTGQNGLPSDPTKVTVKTNDKPVINATDKVLTVGDTFDPMAGVTATDKEDGNLTSKIIVTSNNVDTTKAGTYAVTYSVTDSDKNTTTKTISVKVNEAIAKTIKINENVTAAFTGTTQQFTATTTPAGQAVEWTSSNVAVATINKTTGAVAYKTPGTVTFTATLASGTKATLTVVVTDEKVDVASPVITSDIYSTTTSATGTAPTPGQVIAYVNGLPIGTADVGTDGKFTITFPAQAADQTIAFVAQDAKKNTSDPTNVKVKATTIKINETVTTGLVGNTQQFTATTTPADQTVTWSTSNSNFATVNKTTGLVTYKAPGTVTITASLADGTKATTKIVISNKVVAAPVITTIYDNTTSASGTVAQAGKVTAYVNGVAIGTATVVDGAFTVNFAKQPKDTVISFVAEDAQGTTSTPTTKTVIGSTVKINEDITKGLVGDTANLTVTSTPADQAVTWSSSSTTIATVSASGVVTYKAPGSVTITAKLANGATATKTITVADLPQPKLADFKTTDTVLNGTIDTSSYDVKQVLILIDGVNKTTANVTAGAFTATIGTQPAGAIIEVRYKDQTGAYLTADKYVGKTTVKSAVSDKITVDSVNSLQKVVTGKATVPNASVRLYVDGVQKRSGTTDANGNYSFNSSYLKEGQVVRVELRENNVVTGIAETTVVKATEVMSLDDITSFDRFITGKGTPNTQFRLSINGATKTVVTSDADGLYSFPISRLKAGDVVRVDMKSAGTYGEVFKEKTVTQGAVNQGDLELDQGEVGDTQVTGTTKEAATKVRLSINGATKSTQDSNAAGEFAFNTAALKDGDVVKVEMQVNGEYLVSQTYTVGANTGGGGDTPDPTPTATLTVNPVVAADKKVTGTADASAQVRISLNGATKSIVTAKEDGTFTYNMSTIKAGDVIKAEVKVNGAWTVSKEVTVQ